MLEFIHMITGSSFIIRPVQSSELEQILGVYRQCEDFLALGSNPHASMEMVQQDLQMSRDAGRIFCGVFDSNQTMIGVVDYIPRNYEGKPDRAYIELLMLAAHVRRHGLGKEIVQLIEREISQNPEIKEIHAGVQVNNPGALRFWQRQGFQIISGPILFPDGTTAVQTCKFVERS